MAFECCVNKAKPSQFVSIEREGVCSSISPVPVSVAACLETRPNEMAAASCVSWAEPRRPHIPAMRCKSHLQHPSCRPRRNGRNAQTKRGELSEVSHTMPLRKHQQGDVPSTQTEITTSQGSRLRANTLNQYAVAPHRSSISYPARALTACCRTERNDKPVRRVFTRQSSR